jgi:hypothetical protein
LIRRRATTLAHDAVPNRTIILLTSSGRVSPKTIASWIAATENWCVMRASQRSTSWLPRPFVKRDQDRRRTYDRPDGGGDLGRHPPLCEDGDEVDDAADCGRVEHRSNAERLGRTITPVDPKGRGR